MREIINNWRHQKQRQLDGCLLSVFLNILINILRFVAHRIVVLDLLEELLSFLVITLLDAYNTSFLQSNWSYDLVTRLSSILKCRQRFRQFTKLNIRIA